jgi:nucleotide-binding universal stress UspA family protein
MGGEGGLNREILELAGLLAPSNFASLHLAHAWKGIDEAALRSTGGSWLESISVYAEHTRMRHAQGLFGLAEKLRKWIGREAYAYLFPAIHLPQGPAQEMIPWLAAELRADLVVMGTTARTGLAGLIIGNTAEVILEKLLCSVLVIKPPGFKTGIKMSD